MNKVVLMGRLTRDVETRYTQGSESMAISRYTLAVDRKIKRENEQTADFINIVVFGKGAEFAEKYFHKGIKVVVSGRIQTGSYTNKDGITVYTTEVVAEEQEFAESKQQAEPENTQEKPTRDYNPTDGFVNIPDGIDEMLPFAPVSR